MNRHIHHLLAVLVLTSCTRPTAGENHASPPPAEAQLFAGVHEIVFRSQSGTTARQITIEDPATINKLTAALSDLQPMDSTPEILRWVVEFQKSDTTIKAGISEQKLFIWGKGHYRMPPAFHKLFLAQTQEKPAKAPTRPAPTTTPWSPPVDGLMLRISSASEFPRNSRGAAMLQVTCTITNAGPTPAAVVRLARLYLAGGNETNQCQRAADVADMVHARPRIGPGQTTSWIQDGQTMAAPGTYDLFAAWDGDTRLKSLPIRVTVK